MLTANDIRRSNYFNDCDYDFAILAKAAAELSIYCLPYSCGAAEDCLIIEAVYSRYREMMGDK